MVEWQGHIAQEYMEMENIIEVILAICHKFYALANIYIGIIISLH